MVAVVIYFVIMERDTLRSFAQDAEEPVTEVTEEAPTEEVEKDATSVVFVESTAETIQNAIVLRGRTEAARRVNVQAQTSGLVISEPFRKGASVEEGQLLCSLDAGARNAQLAEAKARLKAAEVSANNAEDLAARGFSPETAVIQEQAALESAQAGVMQIQQEIERLEIRAPFAGILESDTAELGSLMQPGGLCATILALDSIKLVGFATENDINRIELGSLAGARLVSGKEVVGEVSFLSRSSDPVTRTFRVEITIENSDLSIRDGETAEILISLSGEKGHLLPQHVLTLNNDGELGVRVVDGDRAKFMPVSILRDSPEGVWLSGLPDTAKVITVGQEYVIDGSLIEPSMAE